MTLGVATQGQHSLSMSLKTGEDGRKDKQMVGEAGRRGARGRRGRETEELI